MRHRVFRTGTPEVGAGDGSSWGQARTGYRLGVGDKAARGAARQRVAAYHQARLEELVGHVAVAVDGWRAGSLDAYEVDQVLHHYQGAARELWKFCWATGGGAHVELIAAHLQRLAEDDQVIDWWERGPARWRGDRT
jgi:hypothetical protein